MWYKYLRMVTIMNMIKKEYKASLLVLAYIAMAELVYITLMVNVVGKWYLTVLVALAIIIVGVIIGFFYIKSEYNKHLELENKKEEIAQVVENNIAENKVVEENKGE